MGFLDSLQGTLNRGTAAAERATRTLRLNQRVNDINKERQKLAAQLGASLYEQPRTMHRFARGARLSSTASRISMPSAKSAS